MMRQEAPILHRRRPKSLSLKLKFFISNANVPNDYIRNVVYFVDIVVEWTLELRCWSRILRPPKLAEHGVLMGVALESFPVLQGRKSSRSVFVA